MNTRPGFYGKYWCFTRNNPTESGPDFIRRLSGLRSVTACIFQLEKGEQGTPHFQGYIEMDRSQPRSRVKNLIRDKPHLEKRKGTAQQAINYSKKEDTRTDGPWQTGQFTPTRKRGQRTDLEAVVQTMREAKTLQEVVEAHPVQCLRYSKGVTFVYEKLKAPTEPKVPNVWLFFGKTGLGKTRLAMCQPNPFKKAGASHWFDGYDHHETIIFDDFGGGRNKMTLADLLNYLDRYPVKLPVKGSFVDRDCSLIIVTTNIHPSKWYDYKDREAQYRALARRFTRTVFFLDEKTAFECQKEEFWHDWEAYGGESAVTSRESRLVFPWIQQDEENETTAVTILNDMQSDELEQPVLIPRRNRSAFTETQESSVELDEILTVSTISFTEEEDII